MKIEVYAKHVTLSRGGIVTEIYDHHMHRIATLGRKLSKNTKRLPIGIDQYAEVIWLEKA